MTELKEIENYVRESLKEDKSGHDYLHVMRVLKNALKISKNYPNADLEILSISCLLHDIAFKDRGVREHHLAGAKQAELILRNFHFPEDKIKKIKVVIEDHCGNISAPIRKNSELCIESKIMRDADNIDALGSIGIIRQIAFCTANKIPFFKSKEDIFNESVYGGMKEIITWADKMLTPEGKKIGEQRVPIMKDFLKQLEMEYL
jgi:uncharacterized protein